MIIDFTLSNYRSIRDEQTLSMFAEGDKSRFPDNFCLPDGKHEILKSAGIYGANASGKSNLLKAFRTLRDFLNESKGYQEDDEIEHYEPFLLDDSSKEQPTIFEIEFVSQSVRYIYKIAYNRFEIKEESLWFYPNNVKAKIFEKNVDTDWNEITFGNLYKGGKKKFALFKNNSYLSVAGNSADAPVLIRDVYKYLTRQVFYITHNHIMTPFDWESKKSFVETISAILSKIDTGVSNIEFKEGELPQGLKLPDDMPEDFKRKLKKHLSHQVVFRHIGREGYSAKLEEDQESDGTRRLLQVLPLILDIFKNGQVLIWDEIETSLHPHISELVLKLFNDPFANVNNAQLIFSTHNIQLMDSNKLRRDQIWLSDKRMGATEYSSLDQFDRLKASSPFAKWYDEGRLGGIPEINKNALRVIFHEFSRIELNAEEKTSED